MINRLFSLIKDSEDDQFYEDMVKRYFQINGMAFKGSSEYYMKRIDSFDFSAYAVSRMAEFDLNCTINWVGIERSSKSTGTLRHSRMTYRYWGALDQEVGGDRSKEAPINAHNQKAMTLAQVDKQLMANGWLEKNMIYKREQGFEPLKYQKRSVIVMDDAILVSDRRESMSPAQVSFLKYLNRYAYNDNVIHALIQNLSDMDQRVISKAKLTFLVYERGSALMYAGNMIFPIMKTNIFDWFYDNPWLLNNKIGGLHALKSIPEFVDEVHFDSLVGNALYDRYLVKKKTLEEENTLLFMEKMRYDGSCAVCSKEINVGESGYYDKETKQVYCVAHGKELYDAKERDKSMKIEEPKKRGRPKKVDS